MLREPPRLVFHAGENLSGQISAMEMDLPRGWKWLTMGGQFDIHAAP